METLSFQASARYACLPYDEQSPKQWYTLSSGGEVLLRFESSLGPCPSCVLPLDLSAHRGKTLTLSCEPGLGIEALVLSNDPPQNPQDAGLRPSAHFASRYGWLNDPNGLCYLDGRYHLFYQHNPYGTAWGNMHWGHATSRDLVRWQEWGDALAPDEHGAMFSGSAVVDTRNLSGFRRGAQDPLLLFYTAAGSTSPETAGVPFTQRLAISTDGGLSFVKRAVPVLPHIRADNRDPKVVYVEELGLYVLALYLDGETYGLYTSSNLTDFAPLQTLDLPGDAECPDLFCLHLDGDPARRRWVFWGAKGYYQVCAFEQGRFCPLEAPVCDARTQPVLYAAQTFYSAPIPSGTALQIAWARVPTQGAGFSMQMSFPRALRLVTTTEGMRLSILPAPEALAAFGNAADFRGDFTCQVTGCAYVQIQAVEARGTLTIGDAALSLADGMLSGPFGQIKLPAGPAVDLRIMRDGPLLEIYAQDGLISFAHPVTAVQTLEVAWQGTPGSTARLLTYQSEED